MRRAAAVLALLLVTACGSEVRPHEAAAPSPTPSPALTFPVVTPTAPALLPAASSTPSTAARRPPGRPAATRSPAPSATAPSATAAPAPTARDPLRLVGWWLTATRAGTVDLGLGERGAVVHPCGESSVDWAASPSGLFVASGTGGDGSCYEHPPRPDLSWLEGAHSFAVSAERVVLYAADGSVLARGTREPTPRGRQAETLTPALRDRLAPAKALPPGVRPVSGAALARTWVPRGADAGNGNASVTFRSDGGWHGSDGCNGYAGRFSLGDWGEYLATSGPSTLVGCQRSAAPDWAAQARRLGLDPSGALLLYDAKATLLGRLHPS